MERVLPPASLSEFVVAIVGVGLIGGSLGRALRERHVCREVVGVGRDQRRLQMAVDSGVLDRGTTDIAEAAASADLIVFCTPLEHVIAGVRSVENFARPGTVLSDAASVKGSVCGALAHLAAAPAPFVGAHPMAGSEKSGWEHSRGELFQSRPCIVTPMANTPTWAADRVESLWRHVGMRTYRLSPAEHDRAVARISHVPHLVAAAVSLLLEAGPTARPLASTGFRDTTRIASGDPELWAGILQGNRECLVPILREVQEQLEEFSAALENPSATPLTDLLARAKRLRDALAIF